ncbi:MAG: O-acetyl-ADP-ribose deacetylase [Desulfuromonadaceae bacterium]|nr:O-acetyl-ADP-ribose deacetylase [Desulfuromonadaceae bacterium]
MKHATFGRMELLQGDITGLQVEAIVNAANCSLLGGGGVDGAIHRAAGLQLLAECKTLNGCETGQAKITAGYRLPARYVIHTVGPVYRQRPQDAQLLAACYQNSLKLAAAHGLKTVAFPAISCGVYGYPPKKACAIAVDTVKVFLQQDHGLEKVLFVVYADEIYRLYHDYLTTNVH